MNGKFNYKLLPLYLLPVMFGNGPEAIRHEAPFRPKAFKASKVKCLVCGNTFKTHSKYPQCYNCAERGKVVKI